MRNLEEREGWEVRHLVSAPATAGPPEGPPHRRGSHQWSLVPLLSGEDKENDSLLPRDGQRAQDSVLSDEILSPGVQCKGGG